ncbi:MAG: NADPH-dependent FMN reductase [Gemmatimonadaceae bacterium]
MNDDITDILAISGSLRAHSSNTEVLRACVLVAPGDISIRIYDGLGTLPHFNPDLDFEGAVLPETVENLRAEIRRADALLISSPEYAHGVPGSLKNALDWLVSAPEMVFKPIGVLNSSSRSVHAYASLVETLRTMSTEIVSEASPLLSLTRSMASAESIAANPEIADRLQTALAALASAGIRYRERAVELAPANLSPNPSGSSTVKSRSP